MVTVIFKTFGHIASSIGTTEAKIETNGNTVQDFLGALIEKYGDRISKILFPKESQISDLIYILVNGRNIRHINGLQTEIRNGDVISVFPVTAGG
ncbi:MAG: MoaD family protein [Methanomassiliicoccales archaeon]|nr:MoaD family protein [Methanomassiliicoccales archaeon]